MKGTEKTMNSAFPIKDFPGMSKRFYAACAAMQGLLSNQCTYRLINDDFKDLVCDSYKIANQLIKQEYE
jgi:hypothetical protein